MIGSSARSEIDGLIDSMHRIGIGNTPFTEVDAGIYAKLEWRNRFGSIKDRPAFFMIYSMKESGDLDGKTIIEASSGNTGLAVSGIAKMLGIQSIIVLPENASEVAKRSIRENGSRIIETPADMGTEGSINRLKEMVSQGDCVWINQHSNLRNSDSHYYTTAREMEESGGIPSAIVAGIGTGGTITGIARYFKEIDPEIRVIGVQPAAGSHIHGLRNAFSSKYRGIIDRYGDLIDEVLYVREEDAVSELKRYYERTGQLIGISSGANLFASRMLHERYRKIFTVFPDSGEKYRSELPL
ncbi:PLP-dependent cysteine synthase family protein [Thermoplasma sp.]|uniref:PLP-dependent cysteine synthase family protein n=1 Tax=Thermoplasma sp. TaxID=1973142 RepID=UPI001271FD08|nr:PLP-dependent cysteine synthase family protein [Thermoplasma sp.]KAA8923433.1 MAG: PLP-dependent cysteine synthase family protein [Thermoplasma sp.]